jgi:hypothetical protein
VSNNEQLWQELRLLASTEIPEGQSKRILCPTCGGGSSKEKTLSVTHDGNKVLYNCFRDQCKLRGFVLLRGGYMGLPPAKPDLKDYTGALEALTRIDLQLLGEKYGLGKEDLWKVKRCIDDEAQRYMLPIRGTLGETRGFVGYSLFATPKAVNFRSLTHQPFIGWFEPANWDLKTSSRIVLVEDWFSAAKVSRAGFWAVTLNGTHIPWEAAVEIGKEMQKGDEIVLALDPGALSTAIKHYSLYKGLWENCRVVSLKRDLKYEDWKTIKNVITNREEGAVGSDGIPDGVRGTLQQDTAG